VLLDYIVTSERFAAAAPKLRRAAAVYAPSYFAPYVLAAAIGAEGAAAGKAKGMGPGWLVVAPDGEAAAKLAAELAVYLQREVSVLPARGVLYGADVAPAAHVVGARPQAPAPASRRSPRWPPAGSSSPRPWPCSSASCRSGCSRGRSAS
jgi:hypothetical protein